MSKIKTYPNDSAFPLQSPFASDPDFGLTKREEFAKAAMIGLLSKGMTTSTEQDHEKIGIRAVEIADKLIEALNYRKPVI